MRNLQEQVKNALWPFTVWINCSSDLKNFSNSRPSASNFKSFSWSLEQFFLTVGKNNFGNKIPCFALWRATNQKRQSRRWIQNLQMSELFFLFSYTLNQNLIVFFNNFRWEICCFALWRASNQKCQSRRWFQNLQMSNKTSADWRNKTVGYSWTTGHHR